MDKLEQPIPFYTTGDSGRQLLTCRLELNVSVTFSVNGFMKFLGICPAASDRLRKDTDGKSRTTRTCRSLATCLWPIRLIDAQSNSDNGKQITQCSPALRSLPTILALTDCSFLGLNVSVGCGIMVMMSSFVLVRSVRSS